MRGTHSTDGNSAYKASLVDYRVGLVWELKRMPVLMDHSLEETHDPGRRTRS